MLDEGDFNEALGVWSNIGKLNVEASKIKLGGQMDIERIFQTQTPSDNEVIEEYIYVDR